MSDEYKWNIPSNKVDLDFVCVTETPPNMPGDDYMFAIRAMNVRCHNGMLTFTLGLKQTRDLIEELDLRVDKYKI